MFYCYMDVKNGQGYGVAVICPRLQSNVVIIYIYYYTGFIFDKKLRVRYYNRLIFIIIIWRDMKSFSQFCGHCTRDHQNILLHPNNVYSTQ